MISLQPVWTGFVDLAVKVRAVVSGRSCFECGAPADHMHHVVPRSLGGTKMIPLCEGCHGKVHDRDFTGHRTLVRGALARKKSQGEKTGGHAPYGQRMASDGLHLEEDPGEQAIIARAKALSDAGLTVRAIAAALAAEGHRNRAGKPLAFQAIGLFLRPLLANESEAA